MRVDSVRHEGLEVPLEKLLAVLLDPQSFVTGHLLGEVGDSDRQGVETVVVAQTAPLGSFDE